MPSTQANPSLGLPGNLGLMTDLDGRRPLTELTATLNALCDEAEDRPGKFVVVLRLDISPSQERAWPGPCGISEVNRWERAVRRLEELPAASIAVAGHICGGPVLDVLLASDFRIATPDFVLMFPVNDGHFWPGMAVYRLVQQIGLARARQVVIWGTDVSAAEAAELSLVDMVSSDVTEAVRTAAVFICRISDRELAVRRQLLNEASHADYGDALGIHLAACDRELRRLKHEEEGTVPPTPPGSAS